MWSIVRGLGWFHVSLLLSATALVVSHRLDSGDDGAIADGGPNGCEIATANGNWQAHIFSRLEQQKYVPSQKNDGLQAPNRAQNLRTYFRGDGIEVEPRQKNSKEAASWKFGWRTSRWGRAGQLVAVSAPGVEPRVDGHVDGARVIYSHDGLEEWYEHKKEGLEQGFTVGRAATVKSTRVRRSCITDLRPVLRPHHRGAARATKRRRSTAARWRRRATSTRTASPT